MTTQELTIAMDKVSALLKEENLSPSPDWDKVDRLESRLSALSYQWQAQQTQSHSIVPLAA